jgi:hypothetical protein
VELAAEVTTLERELALQAVRLELAQALPQLVKSASLGLVKKTDRRMHRKQLRRKHPPQPRR